MSVSTKIGKKRGGAFYISFVLVVLTSCNSRNVKPDVDIWKEVCNGVQSLKWQNEKIGGDFRETFNLMVKLNSGAEADLKRTEQLTGKGKLDFGISSELAKVINESVVKGSEVSQQFWQQEIQMTQTLCYYSSLLDRKDLNGEQRQQVLDKIHEFQTLRNNYSFGLDKLKSTKLSVEQIAVVGEAGFEGVEKKQEMTVKIPKEANILSVKTYVRESGKQEWKECDFDDNSFICDLNGSNWKSNYKVQDVEGYQIVSLSLHNWSHERKKEVKLMVEYKLQ